MSDQKQSNLEGMVFRKTNAHQGRHISISPNNSAMRHLHYARIILNASTPAVSFANGGNETGLVCLSGSAEIKAGTKKVRLGKYDTIYIPRDTQIEVNTDSQADIAEFFADVEHHYPLRFIPYQQVSQDPSLRFLAGGPGNKRDLNILIGNSINAGRLLLGFTVSEAGNWTSWPPHEHEKMLEEMYVYFDMPEPAFGIQFVYNNTQYPELITAVRDGDAVLMPGGYHPNVSVPGHRIAFLWAMAAHREVEDRKFGVVNIQPAFRPDASALGAGRR